MVAFTARDEKAHFDVFTIDLSTKQLVRLTENQGNNEHPSWAPNGRALVVSSSRGGLWIVTADGKSQRQVYKGQASTPVWGPRRSAQ
jgi:TolB protein